LGLRVLGVVAALCRALAQDAAGSLAGEVHDATDAAVRGANVTLLRQGTPFERRTSTGPRGEFRFADLPPALYSLRVDAPGMSPAASNVTVNAAAASAVRILLMPAPVKETVLVEGEASSITTQPVEGESTVLGGVITAKDLGTFPLAERSFANIAYLVPGSEPVEPSDPTKARITAVSVGGSSGLNNVLSVDGAGNSDDYIGGFLQNFSPSAIGEFNFRTTQEDADTGRTVGGSVVISTHRGSNDWHGEADVFERAAALNARFPIENPAPLPKQPFSRQNYVGALGGPVVKRWPRARPKLHPRPLPRLPN
jgi:hypothetical protein